MKKEMMMTEMTKITMMIVISKILTCHLTGHSYQ